MAADELKKEHIKNENEINASVYAPNKHLKPDAYVEPSRWKRFKKDFKLKTAMMILLSKPDIGNTEFMDALIDSEVDIALEDYNSQKDAHAVQAEKIGYLLAGDAAKIDATYRATKKQLEEMEDRLARLKQAKNRKTIFGGHKA